MVRGLPTTRSGKVERRLRLCLGTEKHPSTWGRRSPLDLVSRAAQQARNLGHPWIGSEHLPLALLATDSASGQALRACGLSYEATFEAVSGLSDSNGRRATIRTPLRRPATGWSKLRTFNALTRAEGLAAGMGSAEAIDLVH
jgi:ClpA/ClpB-like protein